MTCENCTGTGVTCAKCLNDDGCDCDDRVEVECPTCHGTCTAEDVDDADDRECENCGDVGPTVQLEVGGDHVDVCRACARRPRMTV